MAYTQTYNDNILSDECFSARDYFETITGKRTRRVTEDMLFNNLDENHWTFPISEIGEIVENESTCILIKVGNQYRLAEIKKDEFERLKRKLTYSHE